MIRVLFLQLLYEIGDPRNYILPDVVCDFSQVRLLQTGTDEVKISGAKGSRPTDTYKVCSTYHSGYKATSVSIVAGGRAAAKGRKTAEAILNRYSGDPKSEHVGYSNGWRVFQFQMLLRLDTTIF